jgi:hypothetical protein
MRAFYPACLLPFVLACTPGQIAGGGVAGIGGAMMIGGFTTESQCTADHPCYEGRERITSGTESTRPRSLPVGVIGSALVVAGAVMVIAFAPPPKKPPAAAPNDPPTR